VQFPRGRASHVKEVFDGGSPDDIPVVVFRDLCNGIRLLVIGSEFGKDLVPGNTDADRGLDRLSSVLLDAEWTFNDWISLCVRIVVSEFLNFLW
jgi:hypothetical protein